MIWCMLVIGVTTYQFIYQMVNIKCCIQKHCNKKDCDIPDQPTPGVSCSTSGDLCVCCYNDGKIVHL